MSIRGVARVIPHVTTAGERWDLLAWNFYGDPTLYSPIILLNPQIPIEPVFEAGLTINVPLLAVDQSVQNNQDVAPWKRR
jgi:phage tail protein X